jgi:hypothetical protein
LAALARLAAGYEQYTGRRCNALAASPATIERLASSLYRLPDASRGGFYTLAVDDIPIRSDRLAHHGVVYVVPEK